MGASSRMFAADAPRLESCCCKVNLSEHRRTKAKEDTKGKSKGKFLGCDKWPYLSE